MRDNEKAIKILENIGIEANNGYSKEDVEHTYLMAILALKQQLNNGWIPRSRELPSEDCSKSYLVTKMCRDVDSSIHEVCTEIFWIKDNKWDCERDELCEWKVIAWQPLPEPYREESNDV